MAQITFNQAQIDDIKRLLASVGTQSKIALRRSVSRTVTGVKTNVAKEISAATTLKSAYIKNCISSNLEIDTALGVTGKITVNAGYYRNRPSYWTPLAQYSFNKLKKGVSSKIYKNGGVTKFRHFFVPNLRSGHVGIFKNAIDAAGRPIRTSTGKNKIVELVGTAVTQVYLNQPGLSNRVETAAADRLMAELNRQITYLLSQQTPPP